jgi:hypothetical protein
MIHQEVKEMGKPELGLQKSGSMELYQEVNRLRRRDGKRSIGFLTFAGQIDRFHQDRNPQVAEALRDFDMCIRKPVPEKRPD